MNINVRKVTQCAACVLAALGVSGAHAGTGSDAPVSVVSGTGSQAVQVGGTITFAAAAPLWERLNAVVSNITAPAATSAEMTNGGKDLTVWLPTVGGDENGMHSVVGFRTSGGFKSAGASQGLQIDVMNGASVAVVDSPMQLYSLAGTRYRVTLPLMASGTVVGSASVPLASVTLAQEAEDGSDARHVVYNCYRNGTLVAGNVLAATNTLANISNDVVMTETRGWMASHGHRSQSDVVRALKSTPGGSNSTPDGHQPLSHIDGPQVCNKPTAGDRSYIVDHITTVQGDDDLNLRFTTAPTANTEWTIPLNFRATYI